MNPNEINIAIAEHCGWTKRREVKLGYYIWNTPNGSLCGHPCLPNYHGDLNAMHEAEAALDKAQCFAYHDILRENLPARADMKTRAELWTFHAAAAQRAEAFLRTVGKWKEPK